MERTLAADLSAYVGRRVRMAGWLHHQRQLAQVAFLLLRDRSGIAQVVLTDRAGREGLAELFAETVVEVEGTVVANEQAPAGVELVDPTVEVLTEPAAAPPFELRRPVLNAQLPTLLDHAAVSLRHPARRALAQIAASSVSGFRTALERAEFIEVFTPKVVASATESGANVFPIDWFGSRAYLAQSPQFYKQIMVGVFERVFEVGPVFRAEPHDTVRHLAEYLSLDAEMGFIRDHQDVMRVLRDVLSAMVEAIVEHAQPALRLLDLYLPEVPHEIPVVSFDHAQRMIEASTGPRRSVSRTSRPRMSAGSESGLTRSTRPTSCSSPATRWPSGRSTHTLTPRTRRRRTASTCYFAVWSSSLVDSACTVTRTTSTHSRAKTSPRSRDISKPSVMACRHTVDSRSGSSAGWPGWRASRTSAKSRYSHATYTASRPSDDPNGIGLSSPAAPTRTSPGSMAPDPATRT